MGKGEDDLTEDTDEDNDKLKKEDVKESEKPNQEEKPQEKNNTENLRKVIKVGNPEDKKEDGVDLDSKSKETLEQKRAILQSIKDFDFQIKKNQEDINSVNQKLDSVSKDLDDLVSLYEIVSEQMNPFVGLSKVTKKRIDALENFTKEIDELKNRMGDLESFAEKTGGDLKFFRTENKKNREKDEKLIEDDESEKIENEDDVLIESDITNNQEPIDTTVEYPVVKESENTKDNNEFNLDILIEESLKSLSIDNEIDKVIDEFIEKLLV